MSVFQNCLHIVFPTLRKLPDLHNVLHSDYNIMLSLWSTQVAKHMNSVVINSAPATAFQ